MKQIKAENYTDEQFGEHTINDIIKELDKPGRDPRPEFRMVQYKEGVETLKDLKKNMELEGVVTNVTAFGAFVDVGVHQDGLVHLSVMANKFIKDPSEVVKAGDIVRVWVSDVDLQRKRISLSMIGPDTGGSTKSSNKPSSNQGKVSHKTGGKKSQKQPQGAFADALSAALKKS